MRWTSLCEIADEDGRELAIQEVSGRWRVTAKNCFNFPRVDVYYCEASGEGYKRAWKVRLNIL